jgi:hypothetical protein
MRSSLRVSAVAAIAVGVVLTLTSCTPATFVWGYVGEGSDLRFAFCDSSTITSARITVHERLDGQLEEVQSSMWSGPRIFIPEGAILAAHELPNGWQQTNQLDLSGNWERVEIDLYNRDIHVEYGMLYHPDVELDVWELNPEPGILTGTPDCAEPFDHDFIEQP